MIVVERAATPGEQFLSLPVRHWAPGSLVSRIDGLHNALTRACLVGSL
jgi:hypothetical protein